MYSPVPFSAVVVFTRSIYFYRLFIQISNCFIIYTTNIEIWLEAISMPKYCQWLFWLRRTSIVRNFETQGIIPQNWRNLQLTVNLYLFFSFFFLSLLWIFLIILMSVWLQKTTVVLFSCTYYVPIRVKYVVFAVFKTHLRPIGSRDLKWMNHMHLFFSKNHSIYFYE